MPQKKREDCAEFSAYVARHAVECVDVVAHPDVLESGWWVVVGESGRGGADGRVRGWRFSEVEFVGDQARARILDDEWVGPARDAWSSSLSAEQYVGAVEQLQELIGAGDLQQCNLTRVLSAGIPQARGLEPSAAALYDRISREHGAPYGGFIHVPTSLRDVAGSRLAGGSGLKAGASVEPIWLVSASPELFLRRDGDQIAATPIKGTAPDAEGLAPKDDVESLFVSGEVAAQFSKFCSAGSVGISSPRVEQHPGLVQLVREVSGRVSDELDSAGEFWAAVFEELFPPASVGGFPESVAGEAISRLESGGRGPYCGIFGWIDGDARQAELAVTIRSFWWRDERLHFGTGAGITAGSDPVAEWHETELKAARLLDIASEQAT